MTLCANTSYLNAYLRDQDIAEKRQDWIEKEANRMLRQNMLPWTLGAVEEALSETNRGKQIVIAMNSNDDAELGRVIRSVISSYWLEYYMLEAAADYDGGAAQEQPED